MNGSAAFFGAGTALLWGVSDICARFSGRAVGVLTTTLAMMAIGSVLLVIYAIAAGTTINWDPSGYWLIAVSSLGIATGTLMIFEALRRGPVSLASPTVASYPAISVPVSMAFGFSPDLPHWLAMGGTMVGVWLVARAVRKHDDEGRPDYVRRNVRVTFLLSAGSAVVFALSLVAADQATDRYGWVQALLGARLIGLVFVGLLFLAHLSRLPRTDRGIRKIPLKALPFIVAVGVLDTGGHATLYAGMAMPHGEYAIVASVAYTAVTTMIARFFLREPVSLVQWLGVGFVIGGVGVLAAWG